jgi:hypothetical protein
MTVDLSGENPDYLASLEWAIEQAIRRAMAETGESREVVVEMMGALDSMDQEAVLVLTEGNPTTLKDALARYVRILGQGEVTLDQVAGDLGAILEYPWRDEEALLALHETHNGTRLYVERPDDETLEVRMGPNRWLVWEGNYDQLGSFGMGAAEDVARAVHRATLVRVLADRDHHVQLNSSERAALMVFLDRPSGSHVGDRLTVDAVQGGGVLIRTRPYRYQRPGHALAEDQKIKDDLTQN